MKEEEQERESRDGEGETRSEKEEMEWRVAVYLPSFPQGRLLAVAMHFCCTDRSRGSGWYIGSRSHGIT